MEKLDILDIIYMETTEETDILQETAEFQNRIDDFIDEYIFPDELSFQKKCDGEDEFMSIYTMGKELAFKAGFKVAISILEKMNININLEAVKE